VIRKNHHTH